MKKSWHPQTMQNMERVWKAEERTKREKQQIEQLLKEKAEERMREDLHQTAVDAGFKEKGSKLDWMYQGTLYDKEDYLLGKPIDRAALGKEKEPDPFTMGGQPGATFLAAGASEALKDPRDLARKVRADPMFAIKQREQAAIRELKSNPVRMRQLKDMLEAKQGKAAPAAAPAVAPTAAPAGKESRHRSPSPARRRTRSESRSRSPLRHRSRSPVRRRSRSRSPARRRSRTPPRHRSRSPARRRSPSPARHRSRSSPHRRSPSPARRHSRSPPPRERAAAAAAPAPAPAPAPAAAASAPWRPSGRRRGAAVPAQETEEERAAKLAEMMADAHEFTQDRTRRVEQHRREMEEEDKSRSTGDARSAGFLDKALKESFGTGVTGTVEDRIRRGAHYTQRLQAGDADRFMKR